MNRRVESPYSKHIMEGSGLHDKTSNSFVARAFGSAPRFYQKNVLPLLHPRVRSLLRDDFFLRCAAATLVVAAGATALQRFWFMRQVRDVEKDAKEEELPVSQPLADDSDTELWEVEEPLAVTVVKDAGSEWEGVGIDELISTRSQYALDKETLASIDKAIMLASTEDLMKARARHASDAATNAACVTLDFSCSLLLQFIIRKQLEYLSKTQFVSCLSSEQVSLLFDRIKDSLKDHYKTFDAGEHLFRENDDSGAGLFLIKEGEVQVYSSAPDGTQPISTIYRATESLGAFDIIDRSNRCVSALALTKTRVTVLSHHMFSQFCAEHPVVLSHYITDVIARFWRLASFTLYTFLELRDHHLKPVDVIRVAGCIMDSLHSAALTRKVFKCASVVDMDFHAHSDGGSPTASSPPQPSMPRAYVTLPPNCSVVAPKDVGQFAVLVVEGSAHINGRDGNPVTAGHIIGLANLLATDRAIVDARYPPPDVTAGAQGLTYLIVTVSIIIKTCSLIERRESDSEAGKSMCQMLNDAAAMLLPRCREMLIRGLHRMNISSGEVLFRRNDPATSIYLIVSGRLRTSRPPTAVGDKIETDGLLGIPRNDRSTGRSPQIQDYGRNEVIGMKEVILGNQRTQDAFCVRDVELVEMSRQSLHSCIKENPSIIWKLSKQHQESAQLVNIGVLPLNDSVKTDEFVEELRLALLALLSRDTEETSDRETTGTQGVGVIRLDDAKDNALDFQNSNDRSRAARWIFQQEEMMRFVILPFFDPDEVSQHRLHTHVKENWASIASSQCDIIFVVATPDCSPDVTSREKLLLKHAPHAIIELVMLHHPNPLNNECDPPKGTRRWILPRRNAADRDASFKYDLHGHHHVRMDRLHCRPGLNQSGATAALRTMSLLRQDVQRIARRISGRSVALVLSGGGSRGLAHLGVIRALEDNGIPIDVIGGTSQGAFMAASFALSVDSSKMQLRVERFAKYIGSLGTMIRDLTLPILSYFTGISFSQAVRQALGGSSSIEDLIIPFFCVSTNLSLLDQEIHENGKLWPAVRASMTVVGLMPPMSRGRDLLVDGGYTDNLPLLQMVRLKPRHGIGCIIASDVERRDNSSLQEMQAYTYLSGWRLLWSKLKPWGTATRYPAHADIVGTLMYINHSRQLQSVLTSDNVNLYIRDERPDGIQKYDLSDYAKFDEIVQMSYLYTHPRIQEWGSLRMWQTRDNYAGE